MTDPDGNRWEIYTVLEDIEQKADPATACCQPKSARRGRLLLMPSRPAGEPRNG